MSDDLPANISAGALAQLNPDDFPTLLPPSVEAVEEITQAAIAPNTWRAYKRAWREFLTYCRQQGVDALPADPETVRQYLTALATTPRPRLRARKGHIRGGLPSVSLLDQHFAAIATLHKWADHPSPCSVAKVRLTMRGIRQSRARQGDRKIPKPPVFSSQLSALVMAARQQECPVRAARDAAILLILGERGLRRSEISQLTPADVSPLIDPLTGRDEGFALRIRYSKTDQAGVGRTVPLHRHKGPDCAVTALEAWLAHLPQDQPGALHRPLFVAVDAVGLPTDWDRWGGQGRLRPAAIAEVVKRAGKAAGLPEETWRALAAHSLRSGKITSDVAAGRALADIAADVGHKDINTTAGYVVDATLGDRRRWASHGARAAAAKGEEEDG